MEPVSNHFGFAAEPEVQVANVRNWLQDQPKFDRYAIHQAMLAAPFPNRDDPTKLMVLSWTMGNLSETVGFTLGLYKRYLMRRSRVAPELFDGLEGFSLWPNTAVFEPYQLRWVTLDVSCAHVMPANEVDANRAAGIEVLQAVLHHPGALERHDYSWVATGLRFGLPGRSANKYVPTAKYDEWGKYSVGYTPADECLGNTRPVLVEE